MCNFKQCQWTDMPLQPPMPLVNYQYRKIGSCRGLSKHLIRVDYFILGFRMCI